MLVNYTLYDKIYNRISGFINRRENIPAKEVRTFCLLLLKEITIKENYGKITVYKKSVHAERNFE